MHRISPRNTRRLPVPGSRVGLVFHPQHDPRDACGIVLCHARDASGGLHALILMDDGATRSCYDVADEGVGMHLLSGKSVRLTQEESGSGLGPGIHIVAIRVPAESVRWNPFKISAPIDGAMLDTDVATEQEHPPEQPDDAVQNETGRSFTCMLRAVRDAQVIQRGGKHMNAAAQRIATSTIWPVLFVGILVAAAEIVYWLMRPGFPYSNLGRNLAVASLLAGAVALTGTVLAAYPRKWWHLAVSLLGFQALAAWVVLIHVGTLAY